MSKELTYNLKYREKGEEKKKHIVIKWVSNYCTREFREMLQSIDEVRKAKDNLEILMSERGTCLNDGKNGAADWKDRMKKLDAEVEENTQKILSYNDNDFFERRFNLLKQIVEDNGIKDDDLLSFEFWDRNVEPSDMMEFLAAAVYKDISGDKKKAGGSAKK